MLMEKELNALADEELDNVNGGAGEGYDTVFAPGDKFTTDFHPGQTCEVVYPMPNNGLCYTVGSSSAWYTQPLSVLQPHKI